MPPAAIRMCEPSLETAGICSGSPAWSVGSAGMSSPAGGLGGDRDGTGGGVVVIDRAGGGELATGREDVPLGREDEVAEVGGGGDVAGADVVRPKPPAEHPDSRARAHRRGGRQPPWRPCAGGIDAGGNGAEIGRPAVEEAAVGAPDVGRIGGDRRWITAPDLVAVVPVEEGVHAGIGEDVVLDRRSRSRREPIRVMPAQDPEPSPADPSAGRRRPRPGRRAGRRIWSPSRCRCGSRRRGRRCRRSGCRRSPGSSSRGRCRRSARDWWRSRCWARRGRAGCRPHRRGRPARRRGSRAGSWPGSAGGRFRWGSWADRS